MKACPVCGSQYTDDVLFCPADGAGLVPAPTKAAAPAATPAPPSDPADPLVGTRIFGDYVLVKKLGEGGMGAVYMAENAQIEQRIAIKVLHAHAAQSDELVQRFNREAQVICKLTHPNIIRVFIFGHTPDKLIFLAMEFVEGRPLRDIIEQAGHLDELRAISIMRQCLHALNEAHELGIVHRDLKPDNIMLTHFRKVDDFVKILDFGIAKIKEQDGVKNQKLTQAGVVYGTPEYLSPEQAQAKELDGRSDLYSMGIILYEMVTGVVPFHSSTAVAILAAHVYDPHQPPTKVARHRIHPKLDAIIGRALEKDPAKRYQTAMDFLADLEDLEQDLAGGLATKTTVLDASQLSLVLEVSRASQARREQQDVLDAAKGVRVRSDGPPPPPDTGSVSGGADAQALAAASQQAAAAAAELQQVSAASRNQMMILYTVIAGLVVLLLMVFAALLWVNKQRSAAPSAMTEPPAIHSMSTVGDEHDARLATSA